MRVLVAGAGAFGREHLARLARLARWPGLSLAVADPDAGALARAAAAAPLAAQGPDARALIASFRPQGLIVAAPLALHVPLARAALAAGIPVLVEKPLAATAAEARALAAEARGGAFLLPGHVLRFSAPHRMLREIAAGGRLGRLLSIRSRRHRAGEHARLYPDVDPVLMTMIHDIDLALWFGGEPAATVRAARRAPSGAGADSLTEAEVLTPSGLAWHLSTAWLHDDPCPPDRVEIQGSEGAAEWEAGGPVRVFGRAAGEHPIPPGDDPLATEIATFLDALRDGPAALPVAPADAALGLDAAALILAALGRP